MSDDQILENTVGTSGHSRPNLPPVSGIARKERRDKGVPRKSNVAAMSDQFMALDLETQIVMLEVLQALHRQVVKGRIAAGTEVDNGV